LEKLKIDTSKTNGIVLGLTSNQEVFVTNTRQQALVAYERDAS
jgi:hypothetical protein